MEDKKNKKVEFGSVSSFINREYRNHWSILYKGALLWSVGGVTKMAIPIVVTGFKIGHLFLSPVVGHLFEMKERFPKWRGTLHNGLSCCQPCQ